MGLYVIINYGSRGVADRAPAGLTLASCADRHIGVAKATDVCDGGLVIVTNNAPTTTDDTTSAFQATAVTIDPRTNDADLDGDAACEA